MVNQVQYFEKYWPLCGLFLWHIRGLDGFHHNDGLGDTYHELIRLFFLNRDYTRKTFNYISLHLQVLTMKMQYLKSQILKFESANLFACLRMWVHNYLDASSSAFSLLVLATCRNLYQVQVPASSSSLLQVPGRSFQVRYLSCNPGLATGTTGSCRFLSPSPTYTYLILILLLIIIYTLL